jgi:trans-aconitate methyltransferase
MASGEWTDAAHANRYLALADAVPHRAEGEGVLAGEVPADARRIVDLGTGDGRLLAMLLADRPQARGVGLDFSQLMLDAASSTCSSPAASSRTSSTSPRRPVACT